MKRLLKAGQINTKSRDWGDAQHYLALAMKARKKRDYKTALELAELAIRRVKVIQLCV